MTNTNTKAPIRPVGDADRRLFPTSEITGVGNTTLSPRLERLAATFSSGDARGLTKVPLITSGTIFTRISKVSGLKSNACGMELLAMYHSICHLIPVQGSPNSSWFWSG